MAAEEMTEDKITATPTKRLFINILTKDISVKDCILDLIDNSVDSYIWNGIEDKREIRLNISKEQFEISDTCGGIDRDFLKKDVFRFGADIERNKPTLGIYGIGMKRALLKLGRTILMETDDEQNYCRILWNVDEWSKKSDEDWDIPLEYGNSRLTSDGKGYTKIVVNDLSESVKNKFDLDYFINGVREAIHLTYTFFILKDNIDFYVNNATKIEPYPVKIRSDDHQYQPVRVKDSFKGVDFEIICFIDPHERRTTKELGKRGWNIFCNKRLILAEDTTKTTGWSGEKSELPKFHPIYNEFRGIVFIDSDNPSKLPLNTQKTGLDTDTPIYDYIKNKMILTARPLVDHLSYKYDEDKATLDDIENKMQETEIKGAAEVEKSDIEVKYLTLDEVEVGSVFRAPPKPKIVMSTIKYKKPKKLVLKVREYLGLRTFEEVGENTFDYFVDLEGIEDE